MKTNTLFTAVLACGLVMACKPAPDEGISKKPPTPEESREPKKEKPFLTPVVAVAVTRGEIESTVAATASVVPIRSRLLQVEEAGRLHFEKEWAEGEFVTKGTVIARIVSENLSNEIERAEADVSLQKESLEIARKAKDAAIRDYEITQDLYSRGIVAQKNVEDVQLSMERTINSYRQGLINLEKTENALETLRIRVERLTITAPFDGLIVARNTLEGSKPFATTFGSESITDYEGRLISSGFSIAGLIDTSKVLLRSDVTSKDIGKVRPEQDVYATVYASQDITVKGRVAEIGKAVNQDTAAFRVDIIVENPERILKPGMFARVDVVTDQRRDTIAIDKEYLVRRNNREVVFVVEEQPDVEYPVAREVPVELGLAGRDTIEVTWGLKEGDAIVIRGFEVLQDKTPVSVLRADQPAKPEEAPKPEETPAPATAGEEKKKDTAA